MRNYLILFFLLFSVSLSAQFRMVGTSSGWTTVNDSTYTASITFQSDLTGKGYLATQIADTFRLFTPTEQEYLVSAVADQTFNTATLTVVERNGTNGQPVGQIMVYNPDGKSSIPQAPFGSTGSTAQLQAAVDTYNARLTGQANAADVTTAQLADTSSVLRGLIGGKVDSTKLVQDSILITYRDGSEIARDTIRTPGAVGFGTVTIATLADTSTITALYEGLLVHVNAIDAYYKYNGATWEIFDPGTGGGTMTATQTRDSLATLTGANRLSADAINDSGTELKLSRWVNVEDFGAIPNDGLDDAAAIDLAIATGRNVKIGDNVTDTFDLRHTIELPSNIEIEINGYLRVIDGFETSLTADVNTGDDTLFVTSTANFFEGQWIAYGDTTFPVQIGSSQTRLVAMGTKIVEVIDGTKLRISPPMMDMSVYYLFDSTKVTASAGSYVGHSQSAMIATQKNNITVRGDGVLDANWTNQTDTEPVSDPIEPGITWAEETRMSSGLAFLDCSDIDVEGITVKNPGLHGFSLRQTGSIRFRNVTSLNAHDKQLLFFSGDSLWIDGFVGDSSVFEDGLSLYIAPKFASIRNVDIRRTKRNAIYINSANPDGWVVDGVRIRDYSSLGIVVVGGGQNINFSNVFFEGRSGASGFILQSAKNIGISNFTAKNISRAVSFIDSDTISISNINLSGSGSSSAFAFQNSNNVSISTGTVIGFSQGIEEVSTSNDIMVSGVNFDNTADPAGNLDRFRYSNVKGLTGGGNWPFQGSSNISLFSRVNSSGSSVYFSTPYGAGTGLNTKFGFGDINTDFTLTNTLNVRGGLSFQAGTLGAAYASSDFLVIGASSTLPSSGGPGYIITNRGGDAPSGYGTAKSWLILGAPHNVGGSSMSFHVQSKSEPSMVLSGPGGMLAVSGGTADDVDIRTTTTIPGALYFTHNTKPRLVLDGYSNTLHPTVLFRRGRNTGATPHPIQSDDVLGEVSALGAMNDSTFSTSISAGGTAIQMIASAAHTASSMPARIEIYTTATGTTGRSRRAVFPADGGFSVGAGTFTAATGVINAATGFRIADAATSGNVLRGNGTNFVSAQLAAADVSVAATPTNYTAGSATVEAHLSGIDTELGNQSDDQTAAEVSYDNTTSGLTATNVKAAIDETVGAIPDNIADLAISADLNFQGHKITNLANAEISTDAVVKSQLDSLAGLTTGMTVWTPTDGDTLTLTKPENLVIVDGAIDATVTIYLDGATIGTGAKVYFKYVSMTTFTIDDVVGNFLPAGSGTGTTTLGPTGTGEAMIVRSGSTWYQMY